MQYTRSNTGDSIVDAYGGYDTNVTEYGGGKLSATPTPTFAPIPTFTPTPFNMNSTPKDKSVDVTLRRTPALKMVSPTVTSVSVRTLESEAVDASPRRKLVREVAPPIMMSSVRSHTCKSEPITVSSSQAPDDEVTVPSNISPSPHKRDDVSSLPPAMNAKDPSVIGVSGGLEPLVEILHGHAAQHYDQTANLGDQLLSLQTEVQNIPRDILSASSQTDNPALKAIHQAVLSLDERNGKEMNSLKELLQQQDGTTKVLEILEAMRIQLETKAQAPEPEVLAYNNLKRSGSQTSADDLKEVHAKLDNLLKSPSADTSSEVCCRSATSDEKYDVDVLIGEGDSDFTPDRP